MLRRQWQVFLHYLWAFAYWLVCASLIGALCGLVGALFAMAVEEATLLREGHGFLLYFLPLGGVLIALLYKGMKLPLSLGTDEIIASVRSQERVPILMAPAIFISTVLTHLLGGSAGREGAALQLGGSIGVALGHFAKPRKDHWRIFELCGMAALFSALFGTPFAAAVFVIEIIEVGKINDRALLPCVISAVAAHFTARFVGAPEDHFPLAQGLAAFGPVSALQAAGVGIACAAVAILFCSAMHVAGKGAKKLIKNDFLRAAAGGAVIVGLSLLLGTREYNGGGMHTIAAALEGSARPEMFLLKILFTAITLSVGFKGGEIVPSFFVGATMGCVFAPLIGLSPALGAALGMVGMFCAVTNAPLTSILLSAELFGAEYLPLFGIAVCVSFMLSGHCSLYHAQMFAEPKLGREE